MNVTGEFYTAWLAVGRRVAHLQDREDGSRSRCGRTALYGAKMAERDTPKCKCCLVALYNT